MELRIEEFQTPSVIEFNFEELKAELEERVKHYETLVYDDSQIKAAKADVAQLRKLKKAINDERIRREKEYMKPFEEFKGKVNEILSIIDKPVNLIDSQVKAYEEEQKRQKLEEIVCYFTAKEKPEWLTYQRISSDRWLNASVSLKSIYAEIDGILEGIERDLKTLSNLPEFGFEAVEAYKGTLDLNYALREGQRLADIQKRKAEAEKAQKEAEERAKAEQQAAIEQIAEELSKAENKPPFPEEEPEEGEWVSFRCKLTVDTATKLKQFFKLYEIEFEAI